MKLFQKDPYEERGASLELTKTEDVFVQVCLNEHVYFYWGNANPLTSGSHDRENFAGWLVRGDVMAIKADALSFFRRLDLLFASYEGRNGVMSAGEGFSLDNIAEKFVAARHGKPDQFSNCPDDLAVQAQQLAESYGPTVIREITFDIDPKPVDVSTRLKYFCDDDK